MADSIIMIADHNKKGRYNEWLREVKDVADKHKMTVDQMIEIISDTGSIRELLSWNESEEFIGYYFYINSN